MRVRALGIGDRAADAGGAKDAGEHNSDRRGHGHGARQRRLRSVRHGEQARPCQAGEPGEHAPDRPRDDQPHPETELGAPPHRVAECAGQERRRRGVRCVGPKTEAHSEAHQRQHHEQRQRGVGLTARGSAADAPLARPFGLRHIEEPGREADRPDHRVPANVRAKSAAAVVDRRDDQRQVAGTVLELIDQRRAPAEPEDERRENRPAPDDARRPHRTGPASVPPRQESHDGEPDEADDDNRYGRREIREMRLRDEARDDHDRWQQPVVAAGERPAEEDQEQEREHRRGGVPDVMEDLRRQGLAHQRDTDRHREHQHEAAPPPCQHHAADNAERVDDAHRDRGARRTTQSHRDREQPVKHRPRAVNYLPGHVSGLRVLADERAVRAEDVERPRQDDPVVAIGLPTGLDGVNRGDDHRNRRGHAGSQRRELPRSDRQRGAW